MTCQAVEKVTSVTNGILGYEFLPLLTNDVQTGGLCDMTSSRESYLSTGRLGDEFLETGGLCNIIHNRESYLSSGGLGDELLPLLIDDVETGGGHFGMGLPHISVFTPVIELNPTTVAHHLVTAAW